MGDVILSIAYLIDIMSSRILKFKTLFLSLAHSYPTIKFFSPLLSKCHIALPLCTFSSRQRSKLDNKIIKCIFIAFFLTKKDRNVIIPVQKKKKNYTLDVTFSKNQSFFPKTQIQEKNASSLYECEFYENINPTLLVSNPIPLPI